MRFKSFILVAFWLGSLQGQDLHFSQFNENPALLNPALTGAISPVRAALVYRDQWRSVSVPYQTYGASFEKRFELESASGAKKKISRLGAGVSVYNDRAGDASFGQARGLLSLSGFVQTGKKSFLSAGLQAGIVQRRVSPEKMLFSSQYNGAYHDPLLASGEYLGAQIFVYPEFAAGMLWSYAQDESRIALNDHARANIGISVYRINRPSSRFLAVYSNIPMKAVVHADFLFCEAQSNVGYAPSFVAQVQGGSTELIGGLFVKYYYSLHSKYTGLMKRLSVNAGCHYRNRDAVIFTIMYEKEDTYAFGISYDLNVSRLAAASSARGGIELTIRYTPDKKVLRQTVPSY